MILAMEGSFLSATEQQYYSSLFSTLDHENAGRVKSAEVKEFFNLSKLTPEVLHQITEICGANRLGHFGRSQFYIALKLIAMAQNAIPLPVSKEMIGQGIEVPLPVFVMKQSGGAPSTQDPDDPGQMEFVNPAFIDNVPDRGFALSSKQPPTDWNVGQVIGMVGPQASPRGPVVYPQVEQVPAMSPTRASNVPHMTGSPPPSSPRDSSPFNDNPPVISPNHPVGLERHQSLPSPISPREHRPMFDKQGSIPGFGPVTDEGWASFAKDRKGEAQIPQPTQSLDNSMNNTLDTSWAKFPESHGESGSHGNSTMHDGNEDVWLITPEQRVYYTKQFTTLQSDPNGLLSGADSKEFFEKSKLPTAELSKIWQLSDVNKDGTLSLAEFCTAMHLVVARKHKVELPEQLPASLIPVIGPKQDEVSHPLQSTPARSVTPPTPNKTDENWATFTDSPFPAPPSPSSQSPANFDFASISPDPEAKIFQPIALHVKPDGKTVTIADETGNRPRTHSDPLRAEGLTDEDNDEEKDDNVFKMKKRAATVGEKEMLAKIAPPPPVERTRRGDSLERGMVGLPLEGPDGRLNYLPRSRSRSYSGATLQQRILVPLYRQTALAECIAEPPGQAPTPRGMDLLPPALPPRYNGIHSRSMSLDRNQLVPTPERQLVPPRPTIPPRPNTQLSSHSSERTCSSSASSNRNSYTSSAGEEEEAHDQTDFADFSQFETRTTSDTSMLTATGHGDYQPMDEVSPGTSPPPPPPPRHSQGDEHTPTKLSSKDRYKSSDMLQADEKRSQFANDRKRHTSAPEPARVSSDLIQCDRKSIQAAIRRAKEENTKLSRHNSELQQELSQITEDRLSLEIDLKKLRPFAVNT
ncbi:ralBP1-associated Eps domain-containing protein 1-like isoform X2 [Patiria miniata]|uniref:RalBP1-associated Eps domain-containing protein 1 n=1 Tax=Patiria miniata TaxID=46514 RepID=A0A914A6W0_PATMI|nr:ralBP1-associated Eps domain-containing protein 1-like isoform X2 [Patiria miniata]